MANAAAESYLNAFASQSTGQNAIAHQTYTDLIEEAGEYTLGQKEQFLQALTERIIDTKYTDGTWMNTYVDPFFQDSEAFGGIVQIISTEMPKVRENRAWLNITDGSPGANYVTIGSNVAYIPIVKEQLAGGTVSWAVPYAFTGTMLNSAFTSASGLKRLESYIVNGAENSIRYHTKTLSDTNRNNYMLEKLAAGNGTGTVNVVNLVEEYQTMINSTPVDMTAQQFLNNTNGCLRQVYRILKKYKYALSDMTTLFTPETFNQDSFAGRFIPSDRFVFLILSDFASLMEAELYSTTYHEEFVKMKGYIEVPFWQGLREESGRPLHFDAISEIAANRGESVTYTGSGVVGLMVDKWAIMHTTVRHRTGMQRDDIKDVTLIEHQFTDRYINNLMLPGIVFTVRNYTAPQASTKKSTVK